MARFLCFVGASRAARETAARDRLAQLTVVDATRASRWPFVREIVPALFPDDSAVAIRIPDLHLAFPTGQTPGTRVVLTQSTYQLQRWIDWLAARPEAIVVAHASRAALARSAPEASARRGPWRQIELIVLEGDEAGDDEASGDAAVDDVRAAFREADAARRQAIFRLAAERTPDNPALHLLVASAHMEQQQLPDAQQAIDRALALDPAWEASWFEYGKLWLRADDLERAAGHFAEAARLMPAFAAALGNLGAALAEIEQVEAAIEALQQALRYDPEAYPVLNNLAVICREQGRLDEAVEAGRRVIALAPDFVFGYYNLGHALFLQGRFGEARDVYAAGQQRDPQKNAVQACRLAVSRAAAGDPARAIADIQAISDVVAPGDRANILGEAEGTLEALLDLPQVNHDDVASVLDVVRQHLK